MQKQEFEENICVNSQALVTSVIKEEKSVAPPKLYDLTTLQRDANRLFGFTANNVEVEEGTLAAKAEETKASCQQISL